MEKRKPQPLKPGEKVLFLMAGVFVLLALVGFVIMQVISARSEKPLFEIKTHYVFSEEGKRGATLFRVRGCTSCHRALREGTNMGRTADMDGIGSRRSLAWLFDFLRHPAASYEAPLLDHVPSKDAGYVQEMDPKELHAIAVFLSELKAEQGSTVAPVPPKGESVFIDTMVKAWAPEEWKRKYRDIRDVYARPEAEGGTR